MSFISVVLFILLDESSRIFLLDFRLDKNVFTGVSYCLMTKIPHEVERLSQSTCLICSYPVGFFAICSLPVVFPPDSKEGNYLYSVNL